MRNSKASWKNDALRSGRKRAHLGGNAATLAANHFRRLRNVDPLSLYPNLQTAALAGGHCEIEQPLVSPNCKIPSQILDGLVRGCDRPSSLRGDDEAWRSIRQGSEARARDFACSQVLKPTTIRKEGPKCHHVTRSTIPREMTRLQISSMPANGAT